MYIVTLGKITLDKKIGAALDLAVWCKTFKTGRPCASINITAESCKSVVYSAAIKYNIKHIQQNAKL